jgi:hypothetical protein
LDLCYGFYFLRKGKLMQNKLASESTGVNNR